MHHKILRHLPSAQAFPGLLLMAVALAALLVANSPVAAIYFNTLAFQLGPLSFLHWINDALMAVFFLLVGLEIKREFLTGEMASWKQRILPGMAAAGGMVVPAVIYAGTNISSPDTLRGWAIPTATDIAFALGVLALLGSRVPTSLKVFLTALAIIDDLGAVLVIAVFFTEGISVFWLMLTGLVLAVLICLNRSGIKHLSIYLLLGSLLWVFMLQSGIHATLAGVALALTIPAESDGNGTSPLLRLEHWLQPWVALLVVPLFGFANAGVSFTGMDWRILLQPVTLGVAAGLCLGKVVGVFGATWAAVRLGLADMPERASMMQVIGIALLCGIGFTMSLFIGMLAFENSQSLQDSVKIGVLAGSLFSGVAGVIVLRKADR